MARDRLWAPGVALLALVAACGEDGGASASSGGSAGVAGSAGVSGGAAGASDDGGSDGGAGAPDTTADIAAMCEKFDALPCGKQGAQCVSDATELLTEAEQKGCLKEYLALIGCAARTDLVCAPDLAMPECSAEITAMNTCDPICGGASTPGSCTQACPGWGVSCVENAGQLECTCTSGSNAGKQFSLQTTCADHAGWTSGTKQICS